MEQLIELARRLGRQVAAHERTKYLNKAQQAVSEDEETSRLIEEYQQQLRKIRELEHQTKPVEVGDKHKLRDLEEKVGTSAKLSELAKRQADFVELMRKINEAIEGELKMEPD